jgi:hypothetical protein
MHGSIAVNGPCFWLISLQDGGNGSLIAAILERYPKLKGLLFDTGQVVGRTRKYRSRTALTKDAPSLKGAFSDLCPEAQIHACFGLCDSAVWPPCYSARLADILALRGVRSKCAFLKFSRTRYVYLNNLKLLQSWRNCIALRFK